MAFPLRTRTRGRPGRNAGVTNVAAAPSFNPLTDWTTDPLHGVWASDPLWTPPADGGAVSSWRNGGSVGGDLEQATGSARPTYDASHAAYNGEPVVTFDGTDDWLVVEVADVAQPFYVVAVADLAVVTGYVVGFGSGTPSNGIGRGTTPTNVLNVLNGLGGTLVGGVDANPHLFNSADNGASSSLTLDGGTTATGTVGAGALTTLSIGAGNDGVGSSLRYLNGSVALCLIFTTDPTALPEWAAFKAWCLSFYGITVA